MLDESVSFSRPLFKGTYEEFFAASSLSQGCEREERVCILEGTAPLNTKPCFCFSHSPTLSFYYLFIAKRWWEEKAALLLFILFIPPFSFAGSISSGYSRSDEEKAAGREI